MLGVILALVASQVVLPDAASLVAALALVGGVVAVLVGLVTAGVGLVRR